MTSLRENVWQWIAGTLLALILGGGGWALGKEGLEDRMIAVELQQSVLAERIARDNNDIRSRLERIEDTQQQIALYIYGLHSTP